MKLSSDIKTDDAKFSWECRDRGPINPIHKQNVTQKYVHYEYI